MNVNNFIKNWRHLFYKEKLLYLSENANWITDWIAYFLMRELYRYISCRQVDSVDFVRNKIIHFGSAYTYIIGGGLRPVHASNKIVLSWFHVLADDPKLSYIKDLNNRVSFIHTICNKTKIDLVNAGFDEKRIVVIPLGIDLEKFKVYDEVKKRELKNKYKIPDGKIVIGSFQKDGDGWGEGENPKLIKGPDVFCDVVEILAKKYPIHVLLSGPARGYVKNRLTKAGISYTHEYLKDYFEIVDFYNLADLYIIPARIEGGPQSILEAWATKVPVVSTRVGMPIDIIKNGENAFIVDVEDRQGLVVACEKIINDAVLKERIIAQAYSQINDFTWTNIAEKYFEKIYSKL
jgi:glycosyltransferase involved in cell wall biosynthesis